MKVVCVGADPAALYLGILLRRQDRAHSVRFVEAESDTMSLPSSIVCNPLKRRLKLADRDVAAAANAEVASFDRVEVDTGARQFATQGLGYAAVRTAGLIDALKRIATDDGCEFHYCAPDAVAAELGGADLVVVADPAAGRFVPDAPPSEATPGGNLFVAFELTRPRNALGYSFRETSGGIVQVTTWPQTGGSTVVVEASRETIQANRLEHANADAIVAFCRKHFADALDGVSAPAQTTWRPFVTVRSGRWHAGKTVLMGRAAYTSHYSVGLDIRSHFEDAEALAGLLATHASVEEALESLRRRAPPEGREPAACFEGQPGLVRARRRPHRHAVRAVRVRAAHRQHAHHLCARREGGAGTGARRRCDRRAAGGRGEQPSAAADVRADHAARRHHSRTAWWCRRCACIRPRTASATDWHLVHLGSRAVGGAGLVITEMTDVLPEGRISLHCAGMYAPEHVGAWKRVNDFIHEFSASKVAIQLGHAGRKGSLTPLLGGPQDPRRGRTGRSWRRPRSRSRKAARPRAP